MLGGVCFGVGLNPIDLAEMIEAGLALFDHLFCEIDGVDGGGWIAGGKLFGEETGSSAYVENPMGAYWGCFFE
mgnify:CR=1 FL=1